MSHFLAFGPLWVNLLGKLALGALLGVLWVVLSSTLLGLLLRQTLRRLRPARPDNAFFKIVRLPLE